MNEAAKKFKFDARIPHHSELWEIDPVCKTCEHFNDNHWVKTKEWDMWVKTDDPNIEIKKTFTESKGGFKCKFNGIESTNPNDLKKGLCPHNCQI